MKYFVLNLRAPWREGPTHFATPNQPKHQFLQVLTTTAASISHTTHGANTFNHPF